MIVFLIIAIVSCTVSWAVSRIGRKEIRWTPTLPNLEPPGTEQLRAQANTAIGRINKTYQKLTEGDDV